MANWKKLLVSGSNISQLSNDAGYLTSATAFNAFVTASVNGTPLIADSTTDTLSFVTGSAGTGLTIVGTAGTDTITFNLSAIPNTSLANDGITIAGQDTSLGGSITADTIAGQISNDTITNAQLANESVSFGGVSLNLGQTDATPAFDLQDATNYSFGALTNLPTLISGSGQVDGASITNNTVGFGGVSVALGSSDNTPAFNLSDATDYPYSSLASIPNGIVSASAEGSSQGQITLNGVAVNVNALGTNDSPTFTNLTLSGDLTVNGATTTIDTTNLTVSDKFILLNSGSATATDESGIIFGGSNGTRGNGAALVWNGDYNSNDGRLAIANSVNSDATSATVSYYVGGVFDGNEADAATAQADHRGNIRVDSSDDIWIYV